MFSLPHSHEKLSLKFIWGLVIDPDICIFEHRMYLFTEETISWPNNWQHTGVYCRSDSKNSVWWFFQCFRQWLLSLEKMKDSFFLPCPCSPNNLEKKFLLSPSNMLTFVLCMTCMQPAKLGQSYMVNDLTLTFVKLHILRLRTYKHKSVERKFNTVVL